MLNKEIENRLESTLRKVLPSNNNQPEAQPRSGLPASSTLIITSILLALAFFLLKASTNSGIVGIGNTINNIHYIQQGVDKNDTAKKNNRG
jgi:hypothetical protein